MAEQKRDENMIAALRRERDAYVRAGNEDRVAQVDEQLKYYGDDGKQITDPNSAPQGRTAGAGQQTTAKGAKSG